MKLSKIKRDVSASESGVWVNKVVDDLDIKIASTGSRKYTDILQQLMKPYQRNYKSLSNEFFADLQNKCIAKTILLDWRNLQDDNGTDIPYSETKAYELLSDPENSDLRELIINLASEAEVFRKEALQELAGK